MAIFYLIVAAYFLKNYQNSFRGANMFLLIGWAVDSIVSIIWVYLRQSKTEMNKKLEVLMYVMHVFLWHIFNHIVFFIVILGLKFILINMEKKNRTIEEA